MVTREQAIAILSFVGAGVMVISAAVALYYSTVEIATLKKALRTQAKK